MRVFVHDDFWTHWKLQRAALRLKLDSTHVGGHIVRLWCWVMRYRSKGRLDGLDDAEISAAAGCPEAQDFVPTLRASGFIDDDNSIHDWMFWQGVLLKKVNRDRAAREKRARGARAARKPPPTSVAVTTPTPMSISASVPLQEGHALGSGWSPNRDAQHIAQRWHTINPRGTCAADKASHHFARGLALGIDKKILMDSVEGNIGRLPHEIVDALKPKMAKSDGKKKRTLEEEAAAVEALLNNDEAFKRATT